MLFFKKTKRETKMKYIAPNYYKEFKCIADKCKHSCCVGWEIDIDQDTYEKYMGVTGEFNATLRENIDIYDGVACFRLDAKERCPFLNENNLCDIILNLGEDYLCQICNDHPRFRNFYGGITEIGLGLCCEAAAELIVSKKDKVTFEIIDNDGFEDENSKEENDFFILRNSIYNILQNRKLTIEQRISKFAELCNIKIIEEPITEIIDFLISLERLDTKWTDILNDLKNIDIRKIVLPTFFDIVAEQLLVYFAYRHLYGYLDDNRLSQRVQLIIFSYNVIKILCKNHFRKFKTLSYKDIAEYARLFSSEIEYSEENTQAILEKYS